MQESYGTSPSGNLKEAVRGISNPAFLILMSNAEQFETHVAELEELYPGVPSIGCIGMSYQTSVTEKGVSVTAFEGVEAVTDVLEQASIMPVKYISRVEKALQKINASSENTVCIDFCTGNDAAVLTTMYSILEKKKISLTGGTGDGGKVSVNGTVYTDADVFAFVKNNGGKALVGAVTVAGGANGQDLPIGLLCTGQKIHERKGFFPQRADAKGPRQTKNGHQNAACSHGELLLNP